MAWKINLQVTDDMREQFRAYTGTLYTTDGTPVFLCHYTPGDYVIDAPGEFYDTPGIVVCCYPGSALLEIPLTLEGYAVLGFSKNEIVWTSLVHSGKTATLEVYSNSEATEDDRGWMVPRASTVWNYIAFERS